MNEKREFEPLRDDQCIVRVNQICIPGVAVIITPKGFRHLVTIPQTLGNELTVVPGHFVLIQATEEGSRYPAEIIRIIDREYEDYYRAQNVWPKEYDVNGYVERLAEKVQRAEAAAELERELKLKLEKRKKQLLNRTSSQLCHTCSNLKGQISGKIRKCYRSAKKGDECKVKCKSDRDCLADSPIFPDIDIPNVYAEAKHQIHCGTSAQDFKINFGATTRKQIQQNNFKINTRPKAAFGGTSGCCKKPCCGKKSPEKKSTASGPYYSHLTVGRDKLPPLYGKCTPWGMSKKEYKTKNKVCNRVIYPFTSFNKVPCIAHESNTAGIDMDKGLKKKNEEYNNSLFTTLNRGPCIAHASKRVGNDMDKELKKKCKECNNFLFTTLNKATCMAHVSNSTGVDSDKS